MGEATHISWCDATFNGWLGCTKVSVGDKGACEGCYAEQLVQNRFGRATWGNHPRARTSEANWRKPYAWDRAAAKAGTRPLVFANSLSDVFDNQVETAWRTDLFGLIHRTPHLAWLLLTKRPQMIVPLFRQAIGRHMDQQHDPLSEYWPRNAAIGCTIVTQAEADRDLSWLLAAKYELGPAFAFVSMEPLMEPVDLRRWMAKEGFVALDWVIAGGETDQGAHKARPSHPDWFRSLRDQCAAAGVPFHFKQWGEWHPPSAWTLKGEHLARIGPGDPTPMVKVGKRVAGRLLDGVVHDARPAFFAS